MNSVRSALSNFLEPIDGFSVGSHPAITKLLHGCYRARPPLPKLLTTWNVDDLLGFFVSWPKNSALSLQSLTLKTLSLVALVSAARVSEIQGLDFNLMTSESCHLKFYLDKVTKTFGTSLEQRVIKISSFSDPNLCPVVCLLDYKKRTSTLRDSATKVFISWAKPHKPVTSSTLSRWLKLVLNEAGIDTSKFPAHSTCSASTTKACDAKISLSQIMTVARWSNSSTFTRHHYRPIETLGGFGDAVLTVNRYLFIVLPFMLQTY